MVSHRVRREHRGNINLVLTPLNTSLLCDLRGLRANPVFFKTCQLKSWRSQAYRAVARRRSAYAAMARLGTPNFSSACSKTQKMVSHRVRREHRGNINLVLAHLNTSLLCDSVVSVRTLFF